MVQGNKSMETAEKIVETYVRYVKGWFTISNIRCKGGREIDLLAIDAKSGEKHHIEVGISISDSFSSLTSEPFSENDFKNPSKKAQQQRTLGYFIEKKFNHPYVVAKLNECGFFAGEYGKIIVTWKTKEGVKEKAREKNIEIWDFRTKLNKIVKIASEGEKYWLDDTMRTLQLLQRMMSTRSNERR